MQEPVQDIKGIRLLAAAVGIVAGFGVAYLACYLFDHIPIPEGIPSLASMLILVLFPVILIGIIALISWVRKPLSGNDLLLQEFIVYFELSFFILYYVTYTLYMLNRVG